MKTVNQPDLGNRRRCPSDGLILDFYEGCYEAVYIALHPFLKPIKIEHEKFYPETYPENWEILDGCDPVTWSEFLKLSSMPGISKIDEALQIYIGGIKENKENKGLIDKFVCAIDETKLIPPFEGKLPPHLQLEICEALKKLDHNEVLISDEFCDQTEKIRIDDLMISDALPVHGHINTTNHQLLVTTHWDSHCTFICSAKNEIDKLLSFAEIEGFFCDAKDQVWWGLHSTR